ncbi:ABC transporter ATP-binding protein [Aggregatilinea lenta]|uniref:ABC transporter ATP-binding protein n=1 Tax=Aggregatilinea lenta TaxID=913108 RepID=UPI000E5A8D01|nr:ABC transporter ATP-binding protein [Aggregatilinea lenta]
MSAEYIARTFDKIDHRSPIRFVWSHIRQQPVVALLMVFGAFTNAALASLASVLVGRAVDAINLNDDLRYVGLMALAIVGSQLLRGGLQFIRNYASETFAQRIERDVRDELYVSLLGKSMNFHDFQPVGEIMARVTNDVREINLMMNPGVNLIIGSGMFVLLPLLVTPTIHPALTITPAAFILIYVFLQGRYVRSLHDIAQHVRSSFGEMNAQLAETLDGIEVVKGTAQEDAEIARFNRLVDEVRGWFVAQGDLEARYVTVLLLGLTTVAAFLHALILYRAGSIETGDIVAFMGQISLFGFPVFSSVMSFTRMASGLASAERILAIINTRTDLDQNAQGHEARLDGAIRFDQVDFGYLPGKQVLHDVSVAIEPGQTVAIVGQTGSGKSTLAKLINRIYDVDAGRVLLDGVDVCDWNLASLRSQISIIEQEIFLFSRSVADNIAFGRPDATREAIEEAARKAQADEFIQHMPHGYDTVIGQRGVTLSGGQRQRLAIARAFLTDPRILVLDDSTSAIDSATEDRIQKAIWAAAKGRTTILITHRLSQIRWADHIIVLRQGRIVAQGTHEDLLRSSAPYQRIFARRETKSESSRHRAASSQR